jgi:hypothetical protein
MNDIIRTIEVLQGMKIIGRANAGRKYTVHRYTVEEMEEGKFEWYGLCTHPAIPENARGVMSMMITQATVVSIARGAFNVSPTYSFELLPEIKGETLEEYLRDCWRQLIQH